jgi:hypothetical protein
MSGTKRLFIIHSSITIDALKFAAVDLDVDLLAHRSGGACGSGPKGARQDAARFSTEQGCSVEKPREPREPGAQRRARRLGCAFFWLLFFAQAKKSNPRFSAEAVDAAFKRNLIECANCSG